MLEFFSTLNLVKRVEVEPARTTDWLACFQPFELGDGILDGLRFCLALVVVSVFFHCQRLRQDGRVGRERLTINWSVMPVPVGMITTA